jgi:lipopolysaccharide heptosyltransferase I
VSRAILIIKPSSLGDVAVALGIVPALREHYPDAAIDWLANSEYAGLVRSAACIRHVHVFARGSWRAAGGYLHGLLNFARLARELRRARYDVVIDLQGLLRSAWFTCLTGAPIRVGFADAREGAHLAYNRRVEVDRYNTHAADCCRAAVETLTGTPAAVRWEWRTLTAEAAAVRARFGTQPGGYFVCVPGTRWQSKCWPAAKVAETARQLWEQYRQPIVLTGSASETTITQEVADAARAMGCPDETIIDGAGKLSLPELLALFEDCRLVVTPDSGPMHMAVAAGARVVAIMGPTSPVRHGPYAQDDNVVVAPRVHAPCYRRVCTHSEPCMASLPVTDVLAKINEVLADGNRPAANEEQA